MEEVGIIRNTDKIISKDSFCIGILSVVAFLLINITHLKAQNQDQVHQAQQIQEAQLSNMVVEPNIPERNIDIGFQADSEVHNLLVRVTNAKGETVFLENKYRFKGNYKKLLSLLKQEKGIYYLEIINDNHHFNKTVVLQ